MGEGEGGGLTRNGVGGLNPSTNYGDSKLVFGQVADKRKIKIADLSIELSIIVT